MTLTTAVPPAAALPAAQPQPAASAPQAAAQAQRLGISCAAFMLALIPPTLLAGLLDARQLNGVNVWIKPLHFQLSLALYFATLALLLPLLAPARRQARQTRWAMLAAAAAGVMEIAYIMIQAARGRLSHFNIETPLEAALYPLMGLGAVTLVAVAFLYGLAIARQRGGGGGPGLRGGAALGLILGSAATLVIAGLMSAGVADGPGHWVGGMRSDAAGLPLLGWSTTGGDLRVPHFFATHAMQALPLAGLAADRFAPGRALAAVRIAAVGWGALTAAAFAQALMGLPFLPG